MTMARPGRIDFHTHFVPDIYRETLAAAGIDSVGRVPFPQWSLDRLFEGMETLGIARSLLSISAPGVDFGNPALAVTLACDTNDLLVALKADHPGRIGGLATLPLPDVQAATAELRRLEGSGLEGVILLTSSQGRYWSDPVFAPLLEMLDAKGALVLLHPGVPAGADALGLSLPPPILEFVFDTTRCVAEMIFTGVFDRYPNIRWVLSHLGGTLPFVAWRLSMMEHSPRPAYAEFNARGRSVESYLKGLYYDTAVSAGPASLDAALSLLGPERLVFGSDIPFLPFGFAQKTLTALEECARLTPEARDAIDFGTGAGLLETGAL